MQRQKWGRIINITSIAADRGRAGQSIYAATKNGLAGFSVALARELGPYGVTANCVSPGLVHSDMTSRVLGQRGSGSCNSNNN
jgi:3-oxoacyl-[acyl-carrier protein] reductase